MSKGEQKIYDSDGQLFITHSEFSKLPWVWVGFKIAWGGMLAVGLVYVILVAFIAIAYADSRADFSIQAPTENVDGTSRDLATLDFYRMFCDGDMTTARAQVPVAGPSQSIRAIMPVPGTFECVATVVTDTGVESAQSNAVTKEFFEFAPLAPALSP